ncbi:MAG: hypothetical protein CVT99_01320 [Bacteroidetes bacterium HGW-Bacteroidetes-16]|nr:MAG: hypothetical protein CVT99_01320 [Bacteroidetes bacterium HGW-Bacteroidetes-16]
MKIKFYAISLLLSFLVVLSHEMIVHHHHVDLALNFSGTVEHDDDHEHKHPHEGEHQHNNDSLKEEKSTEHNHPFPFHHHILATNDFTIERTNLLESNTQIREVSFLAFTELFRKEFLKPPDLEGKRFKEPPFLISSLSYLKASALRGPPAII